MPSGKVFGPALGAKRYITVREFRAHMREIIRDGEARILGNVYKARCVIVPIPPSEWHRSYSMDKRRRETRQCFEAAMHELEK